MIFISDILIRKGLIYRTYGLKFTSRTLKLSYKTLQLSSKTLRLSSKTLENAIQLIAKLWFNLSQTSPSTYRKVESRFSTI